MLGDGCAGPPEPSMRQPICLTHGLYGAFTGTFGVDLRRADATAAYDLARFGAHERITEAFAGPCNATRI
jgi:hypothetical protein